MTPEIEAKLCDLKTKYGMHSLERIEDMLKNKYPTDPLQENSKFILPELSTSAWLDPDEFDEYQPIINRLEESSYAIKKEINQAINLSSQQLQPYQHYIGEVKNWSALYLFRDGKKNTAAKETLPVTYSILENELENWLCPLSEMHISILKPNTFIPLHNDLCNFTLNLHLAIDIPDDCEITVANETRNWEEGKCLLFDYSYAHKACNRADKHRICLLMDLWHPNVTEAEREGLVFLVHEIQKMMVN